MESNVRESDMDVDGDGHGHEHVQVDNEDEDMEEVGPETTGGNVMSVVWGAGKLGASFYNLQTSELFLLPDTPEASPDFETLRSLFKEVNPRVIVGCARQDTRFLELLKQLSGDSTPETSTSSSMQSSNSACITSRKQNGGPSLFIQPGREFAPDACKRRLLEVYLPEEPRHSTESEHMYFITSMIPFANIGMVRAAGALLKFLDNRGVELLQLDTIRGKTVVLNVKIWTMADLVLIDHTAWDSLQIFNQAVQPISGAKDSMYTSAKNCGDNLSLFGVMNRCLTSQGSNFLRLQLLRPTRNLDVLNRRFDVIQHCKGIAQTAFVDSITNSLKGISNIPKLLQRLAVLHPTVREWKQLYKTIHCCILIGEACAQSSSNELINEIAHLCKEDTVLSSVTRELTKVIDLDQSTTNRRFYPNTGLNQELDEKREQYNTLKAVTSSIAHEEFDDLPEFVDQCSVVYIPEVGYLLCVKLWREDLSLEEMEIEGYVFRFTNADSAYYQSTRTQELDTLLGDLQVDILELENYVKLALIDNILRHSSKLLKISNLISELDSLLALAAFARDHGYVRPHVSGTERLEIINGMHPLIALNSDFVPNSTVFTGSERIVVLTGPNASGKSIYLKQIGIIAVLALSGSFVPASSATIPLFDRICTRIYAQESVSVGLSTFMIDINQMSLAQRNATENSLVIVDEFGKGTNEVDGLSLLVASLEDYGYRGHNSPTIFLSTHYNTLLKRLPRLAIYKPQKMEFVIEKNHIVNLFKLKDGHCESSYACMVASDVGTETKIITRSMEVEKVLRGGELENSLRPEPFQVEKEGVMYQVTENFQDLTPMEINPQEYISTIAELLYPFITTEESGKEILLNLDVDPLLDELKSERIETSSTSSDTNMTSVSARDVMSEGVVSVYEYDDISLAPPPRSNSDESLFSVVLQDT